MYAELTALSEEYGYAWARNCYFASLYSVHERTIQRWLLSLKKNNFIVIEENEAFTSHRKIWICKEAKKMFTDDKNVTPPMTKMSYPHDKNVAHSIKEINTSKNKKEKREKKEKVASLPTPQEEKPILTKEEIEKLKEDNPDLNIDELIKEATDWLLATGEKKKDYRAFMRNWIRRHRRFEANKKKNPEQKERKFAPCSTGDFLKSENYEEMNRRAIE